MYISIVSRSIHVCVQTLDKGWGMKTGKWWRQVNDEDRWMMYTGKWVNGKLWDTGDYTAGRSPSSRSPSLPISLQMSGLDSLLSMSFLISGNSFSTCMSFSTEFSTLILLQHIYISGGLSSEDWEEWLSSRLMTMEQGELSALSSMCLLFCTKAPFSTLSLCSAASALEMFSCFFHFVRRFWNHIFTWKTTECKQMYVYWCVSQKH